MAYVPQNFYSGQKLTDEHLKHMEAGIATADANAERALKAVQDALASVPEAVASKADNWMIDEETGLLYLTSNGEKISSGISLTDGPGGGGGGTPYAVQYVFQKLTEEQKAQARQNIGVDSLGSVANIDLKKYGITAADYEAPFTAEMYEVARANGLGFQKAVDDAKANGCKEIIIPKGNYPLCWAGGESEANPVIVSEGVDIYGNDSRLYIIFDEDGNNPYFTGTNPHTLSGTVIVTDSSVYDLNIEGERQYRVTSPGWKDHSCGIGLTGNCHNNVIQNCHIKHISGDGIGFHQLGIQLATWTDTFTSLEWNGSAYVASKKMYRSDRHGVSFIPDMSAPHFINSTPNFMWSTEPFIIRCFNGESADNLGDMIGVIRVHGMQYFYFPEGTKTWFVELTRETEHAEDATESWKYFLRQGYYSGTKVIGCELCYNQRGGMSNLPDSAVIRNCRVHNNGNEVNGMPAYYDSTRFGLDQEEVVIGSLTIEDSLFYGTNVGVYYKSWSIMLKNSKFYGDINGVCGLNGAVDFMAINCDFVSDHPIYGGACILHGAAEFGEKTMVGCRVVGRISDSITVFGGDMSKAKPVHEDSSGNYVASENYVWIGNDGEMPAGGAGTVQSVCGVAPDENGNVGLTASDVGALPSNTVIPSAYILPKAGSALGGVKADSATQADTQPVNIGTDGKLYTAPTTKEYVSGGGGDLPVIAEGNEGYVLTVSGGQGVWGKAPNTAWTKIHAVTLEEDSVKICFDLPFRATEFLVRGKTVSEGTVKGVTFFSGTNVGYGSNLVTFDILGSAETNNHFVIKLNYNYDASFVDGIAYYNHYNGSVGDNSKHSAGSYSHNISNLTVFNMACWRAGSAGVFRAGTYVEVWAR